MSHEKPFVFDTTQLTKLSNEAQKYLATITKSFAACPLVQMLILFGSYARGDFVVDLKTGYLSDFDLLVVTHTNKDACDESVFGDIEEKAQKIAGSIPVSVIRHDIGELNDQIRTGNFFFVDIIKEGIVLYNTGKLKLAKPKASTPEEHFKLIQGYFKTWFASATSLWVVAQYMPFSQRRLAAFLYHQAAERYYHNVTLVFEGYKYKTHNLSILADHAEKHHKLLQPTIPRSNAHDGHIFRLLKRAYVDARYVVSYNVTFNELESMRVRVCEFGKKSRAACIEKLSSFFGYDALDDLPDIDENFNRLELPQAPEDKEDHEAYELWHQAIKLFVAERMAAEKAEGLVEGEARGEAKGKAVGLVEGEARGEAKGKIASIFTILSARGLSLSPAQKERISSCSDLALLEKYLQKALTATSTADLFVDAAK
jgi:uncharacterized protein